MERDVCALHVMVYSWMLLEPNKAAGLHQQTRWNGNDQSTLILHSMCAEHIHYLHMYGPYLTVQYGRSRYSVYPCSLDIMHMDIGGWLEWLPSAHILTVSLIYTSWIPIPNNVQPFDYKSRSPCTRSSKNSIFWNQNWSALIMFNRSLSRSCRLCKDCYQILERDTRNPPPILVRINETGCNVYFISHNITPPYRMFLLDCVTHDQTMVCWNGT